MYRKCIDLITGLNASCVMRIEDRAIVPFDPANTDYQAYLAWVAKGNVAEEWNPDATE